MSTKWRWLTDQSWRWKGHVVDADLVHEIEMDLHDRSGARGESPTFLIEDQVDEVCFDLPGMIWTGRSYRTIDVDGMNLKIPSQDFYEILAQVKLLPKRATPSGADYYKLHGWRFCVVFTHFQRLDLIKAMEEQMPAAEAEAEHDNKRFVEQLEGAPNVVSARAELIKKAQKGPEGMN